MKRGKEEGAQLQKHFKLFQALESEPHQATWGLKGDTRVTSGVPEATGVWPLHPRFPHLQDAVTQTPTTVAGCWRSPTYHWAHEHVPLHSHPAFLRWTVT